MPATTPLSLLARAPHRLLFAAGAANLCLSMLWWALALVEWRWGGGWMPPGQVFGGWIHALIWPYFVLAPFIFGFLLTVFPRWMQLADYSGWDFIPIALSLLAGQLLILASPWLGGASLQVGLLLGAAAWWFGLARLFDRLRRDRTRCWHARSVTLAIGAGAFGMLMVQLYGWTGDARWMTAAIKLGLFGVLLPIYLTVAHRMFPFFAQCVDRGYVMWRPNWVLGVFWAYCVTHGAFEWLGLGRLIWLVDLPMTVFGFWLVRRWWPRGAGNMMLQALFVGMLWLPLAGMLFTAQSFIEWTTGQIVLGRAPTHALTIGLFGSLLVAMVSRVSKGHSGRPLVMSAVDHSAFVAMQLLAISRVGAELSGDPMLWNALLALGWVLILLPWLVQGWWIWSTPRIDGKPG